MRGLKHFALSAVAFALATWVSLAQAGTITINKFTGIPGGAGAEIIASQSGFDDCCSGTLEWLQMITLTNSTGAATGIPAVFGSSQFIDPQPGKTIRPGLTTDKDPWYDFTYKNFPKAGATPNLGMGPYIFDRPSGWAGIARAQGAAGGYTLNFVATTLLVCVTSNPPNPQTDPLTAGTATLLGGFTWGFSVTNPAPNPPGNPTGGPVTTTLMQPTSIGDPSTYGLGTINSQLGNFQKNGGTYYQVSDNTDPCCDDPDFVVVPMPSALYGIPVCCVVGLVACRRWTKEAA